MANRLDRRPAASAGRRRFLRAQAFGPALAGLLIVTFAIYRIHFDPPWTWAAAILIVSPAWVWLIRELRRARPAHFVRDVTAMTACTALSTSIGWGLAYLTAMSAAAMYWLSIHPAQAGQLVAMTTIAGYGGMFLCAVYRKI